MSTFLVLLSLIAVGSSMFILGAFLGYHLAGVGVRKVLAKALTEEEAAALRAKLDAVKTL